MLALCWHSGTLLALCWHSAGGPGLKSQKTTPTTYRRPPTADHTTYHTTYHYIDGLLKQQLFARSTIRTVYFYGLRLRLTTRLRCTNYYAIRAYRESIYQGPAHCTNLSPGGEATRPEVMAFATPNFVLTSRYWANIVVAGTWWGRVAVDSERALFYIVVAMVVEFL
ncbi:hypothetical protein GGR57DRAFT_339063 [Xylariaceae sp. FL1272]|nr:hypothetical protein GGR57DRAFT_339063 [Xylariaceae sp. FL1272]